MTLPSGDPAYTRDGALKRNGDGLIVTSDGYPVVPDVTIPEDARQITINADGEVYAYFDGQTDAQLLGQARTQHLVLGQRLALPARPVQGE